jgi:hypothetical protein
MLFIALNTAIHALLSISPVQSLIGATVIEHGLTPITAIIKHFSATEDCSSKHSRLNRADQKAGAAPKY